MKLPASRVACSQHDVPVSSAPTGVTSPPAPGPLRVRVHPSMNFTSPAQFQPLQTCPRSCLRERLPWGFLPHRDINRASPLASEHPKLALRSALAVSHGLDGLLLS